jgi:hypothetical protein
MSRRRGSATALNASEVVLALAMTELLHAYMGICQASLIQFPHHAESCLAEKLKIHGARLEKRIIASFHTMVKGVDTALGRNWKLRLRFS